MTRRHYVTATRTAELQARLSARDRAVLDALAMLGVASAGQLQRLHFAHLRGVSAARQRQRALQRLHTLALVARLGRRVGGADGGSAGYVYTLDIAGQRIAQTHDGRRPRRPRTPSPRFLNHTLAITETYVRLVEVTRTSPLTLACFHTEPGCWRSFLGPYGQPLTLKPDAYAALKAPRWEDRYFIEIDLATESTTAIARKCEVYRRYWASGREQADHGVFPLVLFLTPDQQRRAQLREVIANQPPDSQRLYHIGVMGQTDELFTEDEPTVDSYSTKR